MKTTFSTPLCLALAFLIAGGCASNRGGRRAGSTPKGSEVGEKTEKQPAGTVARKAQPEPARPAGRPGAAPKVQCPTGAVFTPARWPAGTGHLRRYHTETELEKVKTTKATPVEVCGFRAKVVWLMRAKCPDGSHPFATPRQAFTARVGNVGPGGRCRTIVDLYRVPCPKKTYKIYMDAYHCEPGERFP